MKFEKTQELRANFLQLLYTTCNGNSEQDADMFELGNQLGIPFEDILKIVSYLHQERLISYGGIGPLINISHTGIKKVEGLLNESVKASTGNIITISTMQNSSIQQGSPNSQLTFTLTQYNQSQLQSFLQELEKSLDKLPVSVEEKRELEAELQTVKTQLQSPKPKNAIINASLNTFRSILESITANLYTSNLVEMLQRIL